MWGFLRPYLNDNDAAVFTMGDFAPPDLPVRRVEIIPPAIDPISPKNLPLPERIAAPMVGGMVSATILTLVLIPIIYKIWGARQLRRAAKQEGTP